MGRLRGALAAVLAGMVLVATAATAGDRSSRAWAADGPPAAVAAGDFQSEAGCPADWAPDCRGSELLDPDGDGVLARTFALPAGTYRYKIAVNGTFDENYGRGGVRDGKEIPFQVRDGGAPVRIYYDPVTHDSVTDAAKGIPIAVGSFQSELGCPADWSPSCLRGWLHDRSGRGIATFSTRALPVGSYRMKVVRGESWDVNYGRFGRRDGADISFRVLRPGQRVTISFLASRHLPFVVVR